MQLNPPVDKELLKAQINTDHMFVERPKSSSLFLNYIVDTVV